MTALGEAQVRLALGEAQVRLAEIIGIAESYIVFIAIMMTS